MKPIKIFPITLALVASATLAWGQITLTLTDEQGRSTFPAKPGEDVWIIVNLSLPEGEEILSGQFTISYDPQTLTCREVQPGSLLAGYTTPPSQEEADGAVPYLLSNIEKDADGNETGKAIIAFAGTEPLSTEENELLRIRFIPMESDSFDEEGETTQINIEDALFNEDIQPNVSGAILEYQSPGEVLWFLNITVTSDNQSVEPQQLKLGVSQGGTDGFDPGLDEAAPPKPPTVVLYAYFPIQDPDFPGITALKTDVRAVFQDVKSWDFIVESPENGFTLSWDVSAVPANFGSILLKYNGQTVDMRAESSRHFDPAQSQQFTIQISSVAEIEIALSPGWNMISIPGEPVNSDPSSLKQTDNIILPLYTWNPDTLSYEQVSELKAGEGYWILSLAQETITVQLQPVSSLTVHLKPGWNMVGSVFGGAWDATDPQDTPDNTVFPPVYWYNPSTFSYEQKAAVEPGIAVWVLALGECDLTLSAAPGAPRIAEDKSKPRTWELPIAVEGLGSKQILVLGLSEKASLGFDPNLDLPLPPKPMGARMDAYIVMGDKLIKRLMKDIRPTGSEAVWTIKIDGAGDALLSWGSVDNPYGVFLLECDGKTVDMRETESCRISGGVVKVRYIPYSIWNLRVKPTRTALLPNYPNPFNPETWIPFQLAEDADVSLTIYDIRGRIVKRIDLGYRKAGYYTSREKAAYWDGRNERGEPVASGVYLVELKAGRFRALRKLVLLK